MIHFRHRVVSKYEIDGRAISGILIERNQHYYTIQPVYNTVKRCCYDEAVEYHTTVPNKFPVRHDNGREWTDESINFELWLALGYQPEVLLDEPNPAAIRLPYIET